MTSVSKNVHFDKLDDIINKYNNAYHSAIKMKPFDVKSDIYIDPSKETNDKNPKFKIGNNVRISIYKNVFSKGYTPNWSEEVFVIKKVEKLYREHILLMVLKDKKLLEHFTKTSCKNQIQKNLEVKKQ